MTELQSKLIGEIIGLARATDGNEHLINDSATTLIIDSLCAIQPGSKADSATLELLLGRAEAEKRKMVPNCFLCASPCGRTSAYSLERLQNADEDVRALKCILLSGISVLATYAHCGQRSTELDRFFYNALILIGMEDFGISELKPYVLELGKLQAQIMF